MTKTNYDQLENFKRVEKKIERARSTRYVINYNTIQKQKNVKVHPLNFEEVFNYIRLYVNSQDPFKMSFK